VVSSLDSEAVVSATGAHWESTGWDYWSGSAIESTIEVLHALVVLSPHDPFVPAASRWLMLARDGSGWDCPHDSAQAIAALAAYARAAREGTADYSYRVTVDGAARLQGGYGPGNQRQVRMLRVPVAGLGRSRPNPVVIGRQAQGGAFGPGPLYYLARLHYYLRAGSIAPLNQGVTVSRRYLNLQGQTITSAPAGSVIKVQLTIRTTATLFYADIEDPIPAGCEPIDESLNTSQQGLFRPPWWWGQLGTVQDLNWYLLHSDLHDNRVSLYAYFLPPGVFRYTYFTTATVPGRFEVAPTHAAETFFPEVFGRSAGQTFTVR
jgi:uncharacterized protein YfaS (alpha-2-macroglobulin family)